MQLENLPRPYDEYVLVKEDLTFMHVRVLKVFGEKEISYQNFYDGTILYRVPLDYFQKNIVSVVKKKEAKK